MIVRIVDHPSNILYYKYSIKNILYLLIFSDYFIKYNYPLYIVF